MDGCSNHDFFGQLLHRKLERQFAINKPNGIRGPDFMG